MPRRQPRRKLTLPVLLATLVCVALPVPALADSGKGQGKGRQDKSGYERSGDKRDASREKRDDGRRHEQSGRGQSGKNRQGSYNPYDDGRGPGEPSGRGRSVEQRQSLSPQQAVQRAQSRYGGQVLKVQPSGNGYQVRLLKDDGRVVEVPIGD